MKTTVADMYYLKSLDHYDHCLEMVIEYLNYALAYDEHHVQSLSLMGQVYMYHLKDYALALQYFTYALQTDIRHIEVFEHYILLKIWVGDYHGAEKIMVFAKKVRGVNTSRLLSLQSRILEAKGLYKEALMSLDMALLNCFDTYDISDLECQSKRIKTKLKLKKKQAKLMRKSAKLKVV